MGKNILAIEKISKLLLRFSIPAIISGLVSALYNIVDQIFIGQSVGVLGNAATNVAFPLVTVCLATSLLCGIGTASNFSLCQGRGEDEKAKKIVGNGIFFATVLGLIISIIVFLFLDNLLYFFGSTEKIFPYARTYTGITNFGIPFIILSTVMSFIIRADGSPKFSMMSILSGALANTILDPIFIFGLNMGIAGAAWATVIGQIISFCCVIYYLFYKMKSFKVTKEILFSPSLDLIKNIIFLGMGPATNQLAMMIVQITLNNVLMYYGERSIYGGAIPLACVGIITKINIIFISIIIGIAQGAQPIIGFNYGAKNYERVKETFKIMIGTGITISTLAFLIFQIFPRELTSIFGDGTEEYFVFAEKYFKVFMGLTFLNAVQSMCGNFFTAIGRAKIGMIVSITRQILFLLPMIVIFPKFLGIDGVLYAGPVADFISFLMASFLARREIKRMENID